MALVHASQQVREQVAMENAMVRTSHVRDSMASVKFGLASGALSLIVLWGLGTATLSQVRAKVRT